METFKRAFVCFLIYCDETVHFVPVCCLVIGYIQYNLVCFPQENVESVQFVDVSSSPECCLHGPTQNQKRVQLITSHDKKDHDGKMNALKSDSVHSLSKQLANTELNSI